MFSGMGGTWASRAAGVGGGVEHLAGIGPRASACRVKAKSPILGAVALAHVLILLSAFAAEAQCTSVGFSTPSPVVTKATIAAVAAVSASAGSLISSINSANTEFLMQSTAFIGSPPNPQPDQQGGGVWARAVGGHQTSSTTATAANINFGGPAPGSVTCNTRTSEDFAGTQIGTDFARLNVNGWNLHAGSTIGYLGSKTQDATPPGLNPPASFRDSFQVPFVGIYGAASYGGFLVDGQVRGHSYQNEVSDNNHGLSGQHFDARGISLSGNVAYNKSLGNNWVIQPSAGIIWSRTHVDPLNVPGTGILGTPVGPGFVPPWVLAVDDIQSTLGRVGVRVGTSVESGNVVLQPFASASIFHEFQGGVTASLKSDFSAIGLGLPTLSSGVSTSNLGTYGQFGLGIMAQVMDTGWLSYLRIDYRTGDNIEGWSATGSLRYQFVPDPMTGKGKREPVIAMPAAYDWTGFYIGGYAGADGGVTNWNFVGEGTTTAPHFAGFLGGGDIGYNYQIGKWVFGVEGGAGWTNAHGARPCPNDFFFNCEINVNWLSTTTARIGYAYWDRLLTYVKGGAAIVRDQAQYVCDTNSQPTTVPLVGCPSQSDAKIKVGGTFGVGSEFGLTQNVSVKSEIMYFDLGTDRRNMGGIEADMRRSGFISTVGLNFNFR
jgi:outer membrane autotransporter protein